jgi:hypothetical protein
MKSLIPWLLSLILLSALVACSPTTQPAEVVQYTKPPFEPRNPALTMAVHQTATAEVLAAQQVKTQQAEATLQAEVTARAEAQAALATATASAREAEILAYSYVDPFDSNDLDWREADEDNDYWQGTIAIQDGTYTWDIQTVKQPFLGWSEFIPAQNLEDFDLALKARRLTGTSHQACFGLLFRISPDGFDAGAYILSVCDNGYYKLLYYDVEQSWEVIQDWTQTDAIRADDWNLLEISARGEDFSLTINHQPVGAFSDSRLPSGRVAILVDIYGYEPARIVFDVFALQPR